MKKVLITTTTFGEIGTEPENILRGSGLEVVKNPYGRKVAKDELLMLAADVEWIIAGTESYVAETLKQLKNLKCISRVGVGIDAIDLRAADELGIKVLNTPYGPTDAVAELALALALALLRKISKMDRDMKNGIWKKLNGNLLKGKTVGIVGYGRIGRRTAELFRAFGTQIIFYDPMVEIGDLTDRKSSFDDLLKNADIVSMHLSGGKDSKDLISSREFSTMKRNALLINLSRGGIVNETALLAALRDGVISGAALDVFDNEPYNGELCGFDNVIATPHIGSYAEESKLQMEIDAVNNLLSFMRESGAL